MTQPVAVEGAEVGDAIVHPHPRHRRSPRWPRRPAPTASMEGRFYGDPYCAQGLPGVRARRRGDGRRGHRPGLRPLRRLRRRRPRRSRSPTATRSPSTTTRGLGVTVGRAARRELAHDAAARRRPARTRSRTRSCCSPRTTSSAWWRGCGRSWASSARRRASPCPTRTTPATSAPFLVGAPHARAITPEQLAAPHRRPHGHRRRPRRRDPDLPGQGRRAAASTWATCTPCRATARSPATPATSPAPSRCRCTSLKGLAIDGPLLFPARRGPAVPGPAADGRGARAGARARGARTASTSIEESLPISVVGTGPDLNAATDNGLERAGRAARHDGAGGQEPRDDHRRDRDRPPPRRRAGHVPGTGRALERVRPWPGSRGSSTGTSGASCSHPERC